jgi:gamma-glutamyltranspeptidase/glutathione hydrolase
MSHYSFSRPDLSSERLFDREQQRNDPAYWTAESPNGVVASAHYLATAAGVAMLSRGGNAVDAAVAASLALGVCEPAGSGLGGMALMLVHLAGQNSTFCIEGPCRAPLAASPEAIKQAGRYRGYQAVAIPTHPAVMSHALERYGTLQPADVLAPAIELAKEGYPVTALQQRLLTQYLKPLRKGSAGSVFLTADAQPHPAGSQLRQPALAGTLRRLASAGFEDFYRGEIARTIVEDMARNGGFIGPRDLEELTTPRESQPLSVDFSGARVFTQGPPGGGLALGEMLNLYGELAPAGLDPDNPEACVLLAAIIRRVRRDRQRYRLRTGAEEAGEAAELISSDYARTAAKNIQQKHRESGETSHLSVVDRFGNAVAMTQSIERSFGAAELSPTLGFLYNGFMRAYKVENKRHPHYLRPGVPARSNACPTIALKDGRPWAVLGSTESERATAGVFETLVRLAAGQTPFAAVHGPRLHSTPEGEVLLEQARFSPECVKALQTAGFRLTELDPYAFKMGGIQLVSQVGNAIMGVAEPRRDGAAAAAIL